MTPKPSALAKNEQAKNLCLIQEPIGRIQQDNAFNSTRLTEKKGKTLIR